jgi:MFS family permease
MVAAFGGGSVIGALGYPRVRRRIGRPSVLVGGFVATGLAFLAGAAGESVPWLVCMLFVAGLAAGAINPLAFAVIAERVPEASRGRVIGAVLGAVLIAAPAGMLAAGALAGWADPRTALATAGIVVAGVGCLLPLARGTRALDDVAATEVALG